MDNKNLTKTKGLVKSQEKPVEGQIVAFEGFNKLGAIRKAVNEAQRGYLQKTLFPTLNDGEILLVLYKAHNLKLDVLNQELTAYKTSKGQLVTIVGKDAKMRLAKDTGKVEFLKGDSIWRKKVEAVTGEDKEGKPTTQTSYEVCKAWEGGELWGAWAELKRTDEKESHRVQVSLKEYNQANTMWNSKPETMIKKVAKSQVCTEAFPELFAGIYEEEELPGNGKIGKELPQLPNGDAPADDAQLQTLKTLGADMSVDYTKQMAAEKIKELANAKKGGANHA